MTYFLVCNACGFREGPRQPWNACGCKMCGGAMRAEDNDGRPMVLWSAIDDPATWTSENDDIPAIDLWYFGHVMRRRNERMRPI